MKLKSWQRESASDKCFQLRPERESLRKGAAESLLCPLQGSCPWPAGGEPMGLMSVSAWHVFVRLLGGTLQIRHWTILIQSG